MDAGRIPFVDAHAHLWKLGADIRYPWLQAPADAGPNGSVEAIASDYLVDNYASDVSRLSLAGMVHVEAGTHPDDALSETEWLASISKQSSLPTAIVAAARLDDRSVAGLLEWHARCSLTRGVRHIVNWHPDDSRTYSEHDVTLDPQWEEGFAALSRFGLSFDLQCYPGQMPHLSDVFARRPDVPVIINHMGMPVLSDPEGFEMWRHGLTKLATLPQVSIKLSGFGFVQRDWTIETMRPLFLQALELFGTTRAMLATDFPTDKLFGGTTKCIDALLALTSDLSEDEQRDLFGRNAARIYRLHLPALS